MGEFVDKAKGYTNEAIGNSKQAAAEITGNARLDSEGRAQERKGEAQRQMGEVKGALGDDI